MDKANNGTLAGINTIIATPFLKTGEVDFDSLHNLIDKIVSTGVHAITILGVAGEAHKLTVQEKIDITETAIVTVAGRCPIVIGTSSETTEEAIAASKLAEAAGATAVMIAPPKGKPFSPQLISHYHKIASSISIPIILQDLASVTGVDLSPQNISTLLGEVPRIKGIKLETPPTPLRIHEVRKLISDDVSIFGGNGGVYFYDELRRGSNGTMNGFAYAEALLEIWRAWEIGDKIHAMETYYKILPLLIFEFQPGIGLAIRKEILKQRGFIKTAILRNSSERLCPEILQDLRDTINSTTPTYKFVQAPPQAF